MGGKVDFVEFEKKVRDQFKEWNIKFLPESDIDRFLESKDAEDAIRGEYDTYLDPPYETGLEGEADLNASISSVCYCLNLLYE